MVGFETTPYSLPRECYSTRPRGLVYGFSARTAKAYLLDRRFQTVVNGSGSSARRMISGVLQDSALGPIPFAIYIRDIPKHKDHRVLIWPKSRGPGTSRSIQGKRKLLHLLGHAKSCNKRSLSLKGDSEA
ncbi:hypothetical protein Trydic_g4439 [Trypoxylus dichotomus]